MPGNSTVTVKSLDYYITKRVKELTQGRQSPTTIIPGSVPDFPIAIVNVTVNVTVNVKTKATTAKTSKSGNRLSTKKKNNADPINNSPNSDTPSTIASAETSKSDTNANSLSNEKQNNAVPINVSPKSDTPSTIASAEKSKSDTKANSLSNEKQNNAATINVSPKSDTPSTIATATTSKTKASQGSSKRSKEYPFYAGINGGAASFGSYSPAIINSGGTGLFGMDAAYFFMRHLGAGLKLNMATCDVNLSGVEPFEYSEKMFFIGPAMYGIWGKDLAFTCCVGLGALNWKLNQWENDESYTSFGGFISGGISYMFTQYLDLGLNLQTFLGQIKDKYDYARKPGVGCTLGVVIRF
jgi:hypothetical protein